MFSWFGSYKVYSSVRHSSTPQHSTSISANVDSGRMEMSSEGHSLNTRDEQQMIAALDRAQSKRGLHSKQYKPQAIDVWAMTMTTVLGGMYYGWNIALKSGFGSYLISQTLMGLSYIVLIFSLAEIISITSFSGGTYGMARVVLGFYPGFICASFELMEYMFYTAAAARFISEYFCEFYLEDTWKPAIAFLFYIIALLFLLEGNKIFWNFNLLLGFISLLILIIYCLICFSFSDFTRNVPLHSDTNHPDAIDNWFHGGIVLFLRYIPYTTWGYGGIESATLVTDLIHIPRQNLPKGITSGVITLFVMMTVLLFTSVSASPEGLNTFIHRDYFMNIGWHHVGLNSKYADLLMIPAQFAMGFGFMLPAAKLFHAMAQSRLLPVELGITTSNDYRKALLYTTFISYLVCLVSIYIPTFDIDNLPILFALITYLSDLYAYYRLQTDFRTSERIFRSPFGILGAFLASCYFFIGILGLTLFQDNYFVLQYISVIGVIITIYYFVYGKYIQIFSDQEQKTLLTLHILAMNRRKRSKKMKKRIIKYLDQYLPVSNVIDWFESNVSSKIVNRYC
jgi:ethanolamine permease